MGRKKKEDMEPPAEGEESEDAPECDGDICKISVNGGPEVPFPSAEATEQVTEMIGKHLVPHGSVIGSRAFGNGHVLTEYADGKVSLDGSEPVSKETMKATLDLVQAIKGDKKPTQLDLEGKPPARTGGRGR